MGKKLCKMFLFLVADLFEEEEERKLYFNNLLHIHQHKFFLGKHDAVGY